MNSLAPAIFIPHGGGPLPLMNEQNHRDLIHLLSTKAKTWLASPKAILLVTAHWETPAPVISAASSHPLLFDYYGFPQQAYEITYNAPGSPEIAHQVHEQLKKSGFDASVDTKRGWDHGVFVPLSLVVPEANIPVIQISVLSSQDPDSLLKMGRALAPLRQDGIAIVGSGLTFHNMAAFSFDTHNSQVPDGNLAFEKAVEKAARLPTEARITSLRQWREFPGSYDCQPDKRAEHFSPFLVVSAAGGDDLVDYELVKMANVWTSAFIWN